MTTVDRVKAHGWYLPLVLSLAACATAADNTAVRSPAVAGSFYPDNPAQLEGAVRAYLREARPPSGERPLAILAPHAGYLFSGQIAADGYREAQGFPVDVVVVLGTNHTTPGFEGVSVYAGAGFRTPLGVAAVDQEVVAALAAADRRFGYQGEVHVREHSIEVQVPFVQVAFPSAKIVAAVVGEPDIPLCRDFGRALAHALQGKRALIVASSDLSHYPSHADAIASDSAVLKAVARLDLDDLQRTVETELGRRRPALSTCACGLAPLMAALAAAQAEGAGHARVISYANSGDTVLADPDRVVGYGSVAVYAGPGKTDVSALEMAAPPSGPLPLDSTEKEALLALARATIERFLDTQTAPLPRTADVALHQHRGAFVTLTQHGQLRGCVGHMVADLPVEQVVGMMALQAAFNDRRFQPVRRNEVDGLEVEISLLTPYRRVSGPSAIVLGRDGVLLEKSGHSAVYLPQVAPEQGWNLDQTLGHLCEKAGLHGDCWRGAKLSTFQAEVFSEDETRSQRP
jgi:AmmeMemoRadiSam system protein B/AmmeMemoRadiSam system protein A